MWFSLVVTRYYVLSLCSPKRYVGVPPLGTSECELTWKWGLCEFNQVEVLIHYDWCPYQKKQDERQRQTGTERRWCEDTNVTTGRDWSDTSTSQGTSGWLATQKPRERWVIVSSRACKGNVALLRPVFQTSGLQDCGRTYFCVKSPRFDSVHAHWSLPKTSSSFTLCLWQAQLSKLRSVFSLQTYLKVI